MNIYEEIIYKIIVMILIYLILLRALGNLRYRTKAVVIFIIGLLISGVFLATYILDIKSNTMTNKYEYFSYIGVNLIFALFSIFYTFLRYKKNEFSLYSREKNRNFEVTSKVHYKEFLYLVFEYKNEYLLKKHKENYSGLIIGLKKGKFQDEEIYSFLKSYNVENSKVTLYGKYTDTVKKEIYYGYLVNLDNEIKIKKFESVFYSKIRFLNMLDFDKEIYYRLLLKDKFDIER